MDSTDDSIKLGKDLPTWRRIISFLSILIIYFFYCYNWMVDIFLRSTFLNEIGFSLTQAEVIFSMLSYGTVPGTIIFGIIASRIGKKITLLIIGTTFSLMTAIPLLNPSNYYLWIVCRIFTGFALGGTFGTGIPLACELFKQKYRAKIAALCTSCFSIAMVFSGWLYGLLGDSLWELLVLTAAIPSAIAVIIAFFAVPDDAGNTKIIREEAARENIKISYLEMYKGKYFFIGLGAIVLSATNFISYGLYTNNATTYLTNTIGMTAVVAGSIYSAQGIGQFIGYNFWGFIGDKFGRRVPLIGMIFTGLSLFAFIALPRIAGSNLSMFYILSFSTGFFFGFSGMWGAYYAELFPERFKTLSTGFSFNGGKLLFAIATPLVTAISVGFIQIFSVSAVVVIFGAIVWFFLPETLKKQNK